MRVAPGFKPRSRGGSAMVTTNPRTQRQQEKLARYLYGKTYQQYQQAIILEAKKYGIALEGQARDPIALYRLRLRARTAAEQITRTTVQQMADAKREGKSLQNLFQARNVYKPEQIWTHELTTAQQHGLYDFYGSKEDAFREQVLAHIEPADTTQDDICAEFIDLGSMPIDQANSVDWPAHVGCPHFVVSDDPAPSTVLVPAGSPLEGGTMLDRDIAVETATAAVLRQAKFWVAGMTIAAAMGDRRHDDQGATNPQ